MKKITFSVLFSLLAVFCCLNSCTEDYGLEPEYLSQDSLKNVSWENITTNTGVFPLEGWDSVLDDPLNPFIDGLGSDPSAYTDGTINPAPEDPKWIVGFLEGPEYAVTRFYAWATVLANGPSAEAQHYTALALQNLYDETGNSIFLEMAVKAYQATLRYFWDGLSDTGGGNFVYIATWSFNELDRLNADTLGFILVNGDAGGDYLVPPANLAQ